jgi:hypothetical protein
MNLLPKLQLRPKIRKKGALILQYYLHCWSLLPEIFFWTKNPFWPVFCELFNLETVVEHKDATALLQILTGNVAN